MVEANARVEILLFDDDILILLSLCVGDEISLCLEPVGWMVGKVLQ